MTHDEEEGMRAELQYQAYTARRKREANCPEIKELAELKAAYAKLEAKLANRTKPGPATKHIMDLLGQAAADRDERLSVTIDCGGYDEYLGIDVINDFLAEQETPK